MPGITRHPACKAAPAFPACRQAGRKAAAAVATASSAQGRSRGTGDWGRPGNPSWPFFAAYPFRSSSRSTEWAGIWTGP